MSKAERALNNVNIRVADDSDAAALAKLRYALRSSTGQDTESAPEFLNRCTKWMAEHLIEGERWRCWVADCDRDLIGCLWLQLVEKIPNPGSEPEYHAYLTNFYVRKSARGSGIGSRLLATALDWCKAMEVDAVILWPTDKSRSLYERHGFAVRSDLMELVLADAASEH